ncbi:Inner membrane transport protein YajR [Campylobacter majalis]|uniref:Inner membrane transport protein YajR n=1 Tax=Campylobacter majalis TaxID=2790656 RepID=A0ABM8Q3W4_9BACT|nr:MFS transporter [Campylobacter majalis]CAD7287562.1 Inner membrane transport protein YajR [Campylobacter majalis]
MLRSVLPLSFIVGNRFFGIFIVLPVLSLYALELDGANEKLVGFLIGGYAITQMIFQVPFGTLSDKIGRKKTLTLGLIIFIIGSFVCGYANDIYTMIFGRLLQGVGAIGAVSTAMISDYTTEENRSKAMAIMGIFIGTAFSASMVLSPILSQKWGIGGLFLLSGALSIFCIFLLFTAVPKENKIVAEDSEKVAFSKLIFQKDLFIINFTNLMQKMLTSIAFLAIPIVLVKELGYIQAGLWKVYAISTVFGFIAMGLGGFLGDGKGLSKSILLSGVLLFILAYSFFSFAPSAMIFMVGVVIFFVGFNLHEPILQSCATKFVKAKQKGTALGIFNSFGYFGSFIGGIFGGYILHHYSMFELSIICVILCTFWFILLLALKDPRVFKNLYFEKNVSLKTLDGLTGIFDRFSTSKANVVKYDSTILNENDIKKAIE